MQLYWRKIETKSVYVSIDVDNEFYEENTSLIFDKIVCDEENIFIVPKRKKVFWILGYNKLKKRLEFFFKILCFPEFFI